ncbi:unnamed protein product, partial [Meganyctiphanes norvegica]
DIETWFSSETSFKEGDLTDLRFVKLTKILKEWKLGSTYIKVSQLESLEGIYEILDTVTISEIAGLQSVFTDVKSVKESIEKDIVTIEKEYDVFDTQSVQKESSDLIEIILSFFNKNLRSSDTTTVEIEYKEVVSISEQIKVVSKNIASITYDELDKLYDAYENLESSFKSGKITGKVKGLSDVVSLLENTKKSYTTIVERNEKTFVSEIDIYSSVQNILITISYTLTEIKEQNSAAGSESEAIEYDEVTELNEFLEYFVEIEDVTSLSEEDIELLEIYKELIIGIAEDSLETDVIAGVDLFFTYEEKINTLITTSISETEKQKESYEKTYLFYEVQSQIETIIYILNNFVKDTTSAINNDYESNFISFETTLKSIESDVSSVSESISTQISSFIDILYKIDDEGKRASSKVDVLLSAAKKTEEIIKLHIIDVVEADSTSVKIRATITKVVSILTSFTSQLNIFINESISEEQLSGGENEWVTLLLSELESFSSKIEYVTDYDIQYFESLWEEIQFSFESNSFGNIRDLQVATETLINKATAKIVEIDLRNDYKNEESILVTKSEKLILIENKIEEIFQKILVSSITTNITKTEVSESLIIIKKITTTGLS